MALPTRDEMLAQVDVRFRELAPGAPATLNTDDPSQATMIQQWHQAHHEVLSKLTDEAFFSVYPNAPEHLDPAQADHGAYIDYWNDIAAQIDGKPGRYDWSSATVADPSLSGAEEIEMPAQDGSVQLEDRIQYVLMHMELYANAVAATTLGPKVSIHTVKQIEALRALVRDGTFQTYDHWWRSPSFSEVLYDEEDRNEELAFVRDLTLEAKIERATGVLDTHLAGWATDFKRSTSFGRVSRAGG
jgi:hypothetical protein